MFRLFRNKYAYQEVKCPRNARELTEEEMLLVNGGGKENEEPPKNDTHTVVSGDTLSEIVYNYNKENGTNLTVADVAEISGIDDPAKIYPGQTIVFPGASQATSGNSGTGGSTSNESSSSSNSASTSAKSSAAATVTNPSGANKSSSGFYSSTFNEKVEKYKKIQGTALNDKKIPGWRNNGDGTYTVISKEANLWNLYGPNWRKLSGYEGDPTKLHVGDTVGRKLLKEATGEKPNSLKIGFNPNEPNSDKRYNARDIDGEHLMTVFFSDRNNFEDYSNYYLTVGQYGAANTPVYDGIGLTDNKGNIVKVLKTKEEVLAHAEMLNPTYKHSIYSPFKGSKQNTEYIQNNQLKDERDFYIETETSRYGWTLAAGIAKVSSKTLLDGPAANTNFDYFNAELSWMNSPEHTKMGFSIDLIGINGEMGLQLFDKRATIGGGTSLGFSLGYERIDNSYHFDLGPLKGIQFTIEK